MGIGKSRTRYTSEDNLMNSLAVATYIHVKSTAAPLLRLSPLLRYALATARPRGDGRPLLLPLRIPRRCCYGLFSCRNKVRWIVGDGRNHALFCESHYDRFMETHDVFDFTSEWL